MIYGFSGGGACCIHKGFMLYTKWYRAPKKGISNIGGRWNTRKRLRMLPGAYDTSDSAVGTVEEVDGASGKIRGFREGMWHIRSKSELFQTGYTLLLMDLLLTYQLM